MKNIELAIRVRYTVLDTPGIKVLHETVAICVGRVTYADLNICTCLILIVDDLMSSFKINSCHC